MNNGVLAPVSLGICGRQEMTSATLYLTTLKAIERLGLVALAQMQWCIFENQYLNYV